MAQGTAVYMTRKRAIAVRVAGSAKRPALKAVDALEFEPMEPKQSGEPHTHQEVVEHRAEQLKKFLKRSKATGGQISLCVDSHDVLLRNMAIAFKDRAKIDRVIAFQVEGEIPSTPIEDLAVGYTQLAVNDDGSQLLVVAGRKERLREYLDSMEEAGFEAEAANATIGGALNLRAVNPNLKKVEEPTIWIDFQGTHALFALLDGDKIVGVRNMLLPRNVLAEITRARTEFRTRDGQPQDAASSQAPTVKLKDAPSAPEDPQPAAPEQDAGDQGNEGDDADQPERPRIARSKKEEPEEQQGTGLFKRPLSSFSSDQARSPRCKVSDEQVKNYGTPDIKPLMDRTGASSKAETVVHPISIRSEIGSDQIDVDPDVPHSADGDAGADQAGSSAASEQEAELPPIFPEAAEADAQEAQAKLELDDQPRRVSTGEPDTTGIYVYKPGQLTAVELGKLLQLEIRRLLLSTGFERPVRHLVVSGAPDTLASELGPITRELDIPNVRFIDLLEGILPRDKKGQPKIELPDDDLPELPAICGVALRGIGGDVSKIDFLTGDLSPTDAFDEIKTPLMVGAMTLCAIMVFFAMATYAEWKDINEKVYKLANFAGNLPAESKQAYEFATDEAERKKASFTVSQDNPFASISALEKQMVGDLERIKAGSKGEAPPTYPADVIYAEVLKAIQATLEDNSGVVRDILLESFQVTQRGNDAKKADGTVELEIFIKRDKQVALRNSLAAIEVDNPVWNGKADSPRRVKLFTTVQAEQDDESISRGEDNAGRPVTIWRFTYECELNPVERKAAASGKSGRPSSGRPGS